MVRGGLEQLVAAFAARLRLTFSLLPAASLPFFFAANFGSAAGFSRLSRPTPQASIPASITPADVTTTE